MGKVKENLSSGAVNNSYCFYAHTSEVGQGLGDLKSCESVNVCGETTD